MNSKMLLCFLTLRVLSGFDSYTINQKDLKFSRGEITIKVGDSVTFTNSDEVAHNVYSRTPEVSFDLAWQEPGKKTLIRFGKEGEAEVQCAIHSRMKLLVKVVK